MKLLLYNPRWAILKKKTPFIFNFYQCKIIILKPLKIFLISQNQLNLNEEEKARLDKSNQLTPLQNDHKAIQLFHKIITYLVFR